MEGVTAYGAAAAFWGGNVFPETYMYGVGRETFQKEIGFHNGNFSYETEVFENCIPPISEEYSFLDSSILPGKKSFNFSPELIFPGIEHYESLPQLIFPDIELYESLPKLIFPGIENYESLPKFPSQELYIPDIRMDGLEDGAITISSDIAATSSGSSMTSSGDDSEDSVPLSQLKNYKKDSGPKAKKAKKKKKNKDEPQRPVSAYALFFRDTQAAIKCQNPNASFGEVSKIVASMWDSLDVNSKSVYKRKTELAKKNYLKQLATYRAKNLTQEKPRHLGETSQRSGQTMSGQTVSGQTMSGQTMSGQTMSGQTMSGQTVFIDAEVTDSCEEITDGPSKSVDGGITTTHPKFVSLLSTKAPTPSTVQTRAVEAPITQAAAVPSGGTSLLSTDAIRCALAAAKSSPAGQNKASFYQAANGAKIVTIRSTVGTPPAVGAGQPVVIESVVQPRTSTPPVGDAQLISNSQVIPKKVAPSVIRVDTPPRAISPAQVIVRPVQSVIKPAVKRDDHGYAIAKKIEQQPEERQYDIPLSSAKHYTLNLTNKHLSPFVSATDVAMSGMATSDMTTSVTTRVVKNEDGTTKTVRLTHIPIQVPKSAITDGKIIVRMCGGKPQLVTVGTKHTQKAIAPKRSTAPVENGTDPATDQPATGPVVTPSGLAPAPSPPEPQPNLCTRDGCTKEAIENKLWDNEYCGEECLIKHCGDVFTAWVANRSGN